MVDRSNFDPDALRSALEAIEGSRRTQRVLVGIAYANGVTQRELADWFGVERKTIYNWLSRLESGTALEAVTDEPRPGRPPKLPADRRAEIRQTLREAPTEVGVGAPAWGPELLRSYLAETEGVDYSIPSCRRLLREAGLTYKTGDAVGGVAGGASGENRVRRGCWVTD